MALWPHRAPRHIFVAEADRGKRVSTGAFSGLIFSGSLVAGFLGALTGLGGGVVIVPLLTLAFGVDIRYAIGASLISVIATSSGAASAYVKEGYTNIRIGMLLEVATTLGAMLGAFAVTLISPRAVGVIFGVALILSAYLSTRPPKERADGDAGGRLAGALGLDSSYPTQQGWKSYHVSNVPYGFGLMFGAGALSGLLGIGSGAFKVLAMDRIMRIPFKVSTTTSNFMIGVTAAASAGIYLSRGYIDPGIAMPVMLGALAGSLAGARVLPGARTRALRLVFATAVFAVAVQMIYKGLAGAS